MKSIIIKIDIDDPLTIYDLKRLILKRRNHIDQSSNKKINKEVNKKIIKKANTIVNTKVNTKVNRKINKKVNKKINKKVNTKVSKEVNMSDIRALSQGIELTDEIKVINLENKILHIII